MKNKHLVLSMIFLMFTHPVWAMDNIAQQSMALETAGKNIKPHPKEELKKSTCNATVSYAVGKCQNPTSTGFKEAGALLLTVPALATAFMGGEDSGKMAQMCQMSALASMVGGLLNGSQDQTCQHASAACGEVCGPEKEKIQTQMKNALTAGEVGLAQALKIDYDNADKAEAECYQKTQQQQQLAKQQQQATQQPMAGAQACAQDLSGEEEQEIVDCTLSRYSHYAECSTLNKTNVSDGLGTYEQGVTFGGREDDVDLPEPEDREDYWNDLKNKTSGNGQAGRGGGMGAGAGLGGGVGSGANASNKAGAGARRSGASMVSGGSESSSGGGGWGSGSSDSDFNKKFAGLGNKKKDLNMLTKKVAGQGLGSAEFGASSDDIWTRVYLRTNTRCTKQLVECAANKSQNPYGSFK